MEILLAGKVDIPSITCQKELVDHDLNEKMIPLVIKKPSSVALQANGGSKFRLPFKNNGTQEIEIDFTFAKQSSVISGPLALSNSCEGETSK